MCWGPYVKVFCLIVKKLGLFQEDWKNFIQLVHFVYMWSKDGFYWSELD